MSNNDRRDREMAELRARFEASERREGDRPARRGGCLLGLGAVAVFAIALLASNGNRAPSAGPRGPDLTPLELHCDKAWAERIRAARRGVVRGIATDGEDIIVVVNPFTWRRLGLESQRQLGLAEACQIGTFLAVTVKFRFDREGPDALRVPPVELLELGKARFISTPTAAPPTGFRGIPWGGRPAPGLRPFPGGDSVWVGPRRPPAPFLGVAANDEDYVFDHGRLIGGDVDFATPAAYAAIKLALAKTYGPPSSANRSDTVEIYVWEWPKAKARILISYTIPKTSATLHIETTR